MVICRAILREHISQVDGSRENVPGDGTSMGDDLIDDALYEKRAQLLEAGLDTSRIDAVIERRKSHVTS